jgi:hypothetical protein
MLYAIPPLEAVRVYDLVRHFSQGDILWFGTDVEQYGNWWWEIYVVCLEVMRCRPVGPGATCATTFAWFAWYCTTTCQWSNW